ncbi:MAG: tetratricopeptide repeat protein [Promethearchaeota archaeon]
MAITEELRDIQQLITQCHLRKALSKVKKLEKREKLKEKDFNNINLMKSNIFIKLGNFEKAEELSRKVLLKSERIKNEMQKIDACIMVAKALLALGKYDDSYLMVKKGEQLLDAIIVQSPKTNFFKAEILRVYGVISWNKGQFELALDYYRQSFVIFEKIRDERGIGKILSNIGSIYQIKGKFALAIEYKQNAAQILEEIGDQLNLASTFQNISEIYTSRGKLGLAFEYAQRSLIIFEELEIKHAIAENLCVIGEIFKAKGDLDAALEFYKRSLTLYEEVGRPGALPLVNMGEIHHAREEYELALQCYKQSLDIFKEWNLLETAMLYYDLIKLSIDTKTLEQAKIYVQHLQRINKKEDNLVFNQLYRLGQAMLLKTSKRITNIATAQKIFKQVATEEIVYFELTVDAILNLCELLLIELRSFGNEEVFREVKTWSNNLLEIAQMQHSFSLLAETYLLQSKLALLELDLERAQNLLSQAKKLAEENDLQQLLTKILDEQFLLHEQSSKWEHLRDQKLSIKERINLIQFEDLLDRMLHKRFYQKQEEIMEYAAEAQQLIEKWEKEE